MRGLLSLCHINCPWVDSLWFYSLFVKNELLSLHKILCCCFFHRHGSRISRKYSINVRQTNGNRMNCSCENHEWANCWPIHKPITIIIYYLFLFSKTISISTTFLSFWGAAFYFVTLFFFFFLVYKNKIVSLKRLKEKIEYR